jgi:hypothetical protein
VAVRLARLANRVDRLPRPVPTPPDEDDWLGIFEGLGQDGVFDREPDFPRALAFYRDALAAAHASTDPPFDPPADFPPDHPLPSIRKERWRLPERFPDVNAGFGWLLEMSERVWAGVPPVTEAEHAELAAWFREHEPRLLEVQKTLPSEMFLFDGVRRVSCWHVRFFLRKGPRAEGSGRVAEDIRQLKAWYGDRVATTATVVESGTGQAWCPGSACGCGG